MRDFTEDTIEDKQIRFNKRINRFALKNNFISRSNPILLIEWAEHNEIVRKKNIVPLDKYHDMLGDDGQKYNEGKNFIRDYLFQLNLGIPTNI
jgi:hypothetical protein